jgi:large subunit ribosomal protein L13
MLDAKPEKLLEIAVKGMLPKNRLGHQLFNKLKVYRGAEHPHVAQKPQTVTV